MNHIYSLVFNRALGRLQVASEFARRRQGRSVTTTRQRSLRALLAVSLACAAAMGSATAQVPDAGQLPTGGDVLGGISGIEIDGSTMTITQNGKRAVINWDAFDVGADALVKFVQDSDHIALNHILDANASQIMGDIEAAGTVFLMNRNGILFGADATLNVGGLIASTLVLDDPASFLDDGIRILELGRGTAPAARGAVINHGTIDAGNVAFIGGHANNSGTISVGGGEIGMIVADGAQLLLSAGEAPTLIMTVALAGTVAGTTTGISNSGTLDAGLGGQIVLHSAAAPGLVSTVINNTGTVRAGGVTPGADGSVSLYALGGGINVDGNVHAGAGQVTVSANGAVSFGADLDTGTLGVSASTVSQNGGALRATGDTSVETIGSTTLDSADNDFGGAVGLDTGGAATVRDRNALTLGPVHVRGALTVDAGGALDLGMGQIDGALTAASAGAITQQGALTVGGTSRLTGGTITLTDAGNDFRGVLDLASSGNVAIVDADALSLGAVSVVGDLSASAGTSLGLGSGSVGSALIAQAGTDIGQSGALAVAGTATFNAGGAIAIEHADNAFGGAVGLTSIGHAGIRNLGALTLSQLDVGSLTATTAGPASSSALSFRGGVVRGALSATSTGNIVQTGALTVAGATTLQTNNDIGFDNRGNAFSGTVSLGGNNVFISDSALLRLGTLNVGALIATAPQLRLSGSVTTLGWQNYVGDLLLERDTQLTSNGAVDFRGRVDGAYALGVNASWSTFTGDIGSATALSSFDARGVRVSTTIGGNVTTTGDVAFGATQVRGGNYTVRSTGGSIAVTGVLDTETDGRGQLTLDARDAISLGANAGVSRRLQSLALKGATVSARGIRVTGMLDVDSGSAYTQQGAYDVGGNARFVADGDITLDNAANRFGGTLSLDGDAAIVDAASALALDGIDVDSLRATSVAGLTLADARIAGDAMLTGSALSLGTFDIGGDLDANAGSGGLVFGSGRVGGSLAADSDAAISQTGALDVEGSASLDAAGAIALTHADNRFGGDVGARAGAGVAVRGQDTLRVVDLASGTGSDVELAGGTLDLATSVNTGMGRLTLRSETGALTLGHAIGGNAVSLHGASGLVLGADVSAMGTLALSSGLDIVQTGGHIDAGGATTLDAVRDVDLRGAGNDFIGRVDVRGRNVAIRDSTTLALGDVDAASLDAQAATIRLASGIATSGDQTYRGGVVLDADTALDSTSGDIAFTGTVDSAASGRHALTARAEAGDVRFGGAIGSGQALAGLDVDAARIDIGGALTVDDGNGGGTLSLASDSGGITQSGAFQVTGDTRLATHGGAINLTGVDNDFGGQVDIVGAGAVAITDRNALTFGSVSAASLSATSAGPLDLGTTTLTGALDARSNGGAISQSGALTIGGDTVIEALGGSITLDNAGNDFQQAVSLRGGAVAIHDANALQLGTVQVASLDVSSHGALDLGTTSVSGALRATSNDGAIIQTGALVVGGASTLDAGSGDITLVHADNGFAGTVVLTGRDIAIRAANTLALGAVDARNLDATATTIALRGDVATDADQTYVGAVRLDGDVALAAGGGVAFAGTVDGAHALDIDAVDAARFDGVVGGNAALTGLDIDAGSFIAADAVTIDGDLSIQIDTGGITQAGAFDVRGDTALAANGGAITLTDAGNDFVGTVDIANGGAVAIVDRNALQLGNVTAASLDATSHGALDLGTTVVTGALVATSHDGAIGQTGALSVGGTSTLDAGTGDITLAHAGNDFVGVVGLAGEAVTINDANDLRLGTVDADTLTATSHGALALGTTAVAGALVATSNGGAITQSGVLTVGGSSAIDAGTGSIALIHADNDFGGAVDLQGGAVAIHDANALQLGTVAAAALDVSSHGALDLGTATVTGALAATSNDGAITQGGALSVGGSSAINAGTGDITLTHADNDFAGTVDLSGSTVLINDANALRLGTVDSDTLDVTSHGALDLGTTTVAGALVATSNGGVITQSGALTVGGSSAIDAGTGDIALTHVGNDFAGAVDLSGSTVVINDANDLRLGTVDTGTLTATSHGALDLGTTTVVDALVATSNGGAITQSGALTVGGASAIDAGTGGITLMHADNDFVGTVDLNGATVAVNDANDLRLGTVVAGTLSATGHGALDLGTTTVTGALAATSNGGAITQTGALSVGGSSTLDAGTGNITLAHAGNDFVGAVDLDGSTVDINDANDLRVGTVDVDTLTATSHGALNLGTTTVNGALVTTSNGGVITQGGALTVGGASTIDAGTGDITLMHADNDFVGAVDLDGAAVAINDVNDLRLGTVVAGALSATSHGALDLGTATVTGALAATSNGGAITQRDALSVGGASAIDAGGGDITLVHADNNFVGAVDLDGGAVALQDRDALRLGTVEANTLTVTSHGALDLGTTRLADALIATSNGGAITQGGALTVGGTTTIDAGTGDIALTHAGNDFVGTVAVAGRDIAIRDANTLALLAVDARNLQVIAGAIALHGNVDTDEDQTYDGAVRLQTDVALLAGGDVTVTGTVDGAHALAVDAGGHAGFGGAVGGDDALASLSVTVDSASLAAGVDVSDALDIAVRDGGISQSAAFRVGGDATFDANGGDIALTDAGNDFAGSVNLAGGVVEIADANALRLGAVAADTLTATSHGALDLGQGRISGDLAAISNGGAITQTGALTVGGESTIAAGAGAITLIDTGNDFFGRVHLSGGTVAVTDANALALGTVRANALTTDSEGALEFGDVVVGDALAARSRSGGITQSDALRVGGTALLDAGSGDVVLAHAGNDFVGAVDVAGGAVSLRDANDLTLSRLASGADRDVHLIAGRALTLPTHAIDTGTGSLQLAALGGALTTRGALAGDNVALQGGGIVLGHDVDADGTLSLQSNGDITQTGGRIAAGRLTGSATGAARLEGANRIASIADFSTNGLRLANATALTIDGPLDAGRNLHLAVTGDLAIDGRVAADDIRLETSGGIVQGAEGQLVARTLSGRAGGAVMLGDAETFIDNRVERIGDFTARAGFSMTNGQSLTLASLNGSAFTIDAGTADFFVSVDGDLLQDGTHWLYNGRGSWAATGAIGRASSPIYVTGVDLQTVAAIGAPPAYFYAVRADGSLLPIGGGASVNIPTSVWAGRAQSSSNRQVAYVDVGADASNYRPYGVVEPGIRLPADQAPECDPDFPSDECAEVVQ